MKAFFITTDTDDCQNHVDAWNSCYGYSVHHKFNIHQIRNDWQLLEIARKEEPDVIFYIGAVKGNAIPKIEVLKELRDIAPTINLCSDAADRPWHPVLEYYKKNACFDLQVSIDGALDSPVDYVTLTPVDFTNFRPIKKSIKCGFSGTVGRWNTRSEIINALEWFSILKVRRRGGSVRDHANFVSKCKILLNTSWTGTEYTHHIKGRVLEAGFANCALLEHVKSPISNWFTNCWIPWRTAKDVNEIINDITDGEIQSIANKLTEQVKSKYSPKMIFDGILSHVDIA